MARYHEQKIHNISIKKLKGIENLQSLSFTPKNVTAIIGANCIGKSSLLHALASSYQPENHRESENHRISEFLKPNPHALWDSTEFSISYEFKDRGQGDTIFNESRTYSKNNDRWAPRYDRRPFRPVFYIGIHTTLSNFGIH